MSQRSLLSLNGAPADVEAVPAWATRVRDRVKAIAKNISLLESERQQLLSMLCDADLGEIELSQDTPPQQEVAVVHSARVSVNSAAQSVIDLVSIENDDSCPPTPVLDSQLPPLSPQFTDNGENAGDLSNIDPRELSFELPPLNKNSDDPQDLPTDQVGMSFQPVPKEKPRVFKPEEWSLIDWSKLDLDVLKQCMSYFGLKPSGGRNHMINQMKQIFQFACGDEDEKPPEPELGSKEQMFEEFSALIQGNHTLYEKIILFETVDLADVYAFLQSERKESWKNLSLGVVKEYLDRVGVQYSTTTANNRPVVKRRRKDPTLRKSISCP